MGNWLKLFTYYLLPLTYYLSLRCLYLWLLVQIDNQIGDFVFSFQGSEKRLSISNKRPTF